MANNVGHQVQIADHLDAPADIDHQEQNNIREQQDNNAHARQETNFKVSVTMIRIFVWSGILLVLVTNAATLCAFYDLPKLPGCITFLDRNNYLFCAVICLLYLTGYYEYFLTSCYLASRVPQSKSIYLLKFSFIPPVLAFLIISDHQETRFKCRAVKNSGYLAYQIYTACSMILVVYICLYTLGVVYHLWVAAQKNHDQSIHRTSEFVRAYKECLQNATTAKGIDKFKVFAKEFKDASTNLAEVRTLIWIITYFHLRIVLYPKHFKGASSLFCQICLTTLNRFEQVLPTVVDQKAVLCHSSCLRSKVPNESNYFMSVEELSSMLAKAEVAGKAQLDLSLLQTI